MTAPAGTPAADLDAERAAHARAARGVVESALDAAGWPWSVTLSQWLDALLIIEEHDTA